MKRAIVIGATSGIGRGLAEELAARGYRVGLVGRREALLREIAAADPTLRSRMQRSLHWTVWSRCWTVWSCASSRPVRET